MMTIGSTSDLDSILRDLGRDDIGVGSLRPRGNGDGIVFVLGRGHRRIRVTIAQSCLVDVVALKDALVRAIVRLNASADLLQRQSIEGVETIPIPLGALAPAPISVRVAR